MQVFFIRSGRLIGRDHFYLKSAENDTEGEILSSFIKQFYAGTPYIPAELMLPEEIEDQDIIEEWLTARRERRVHLRIPKKGTKEKLVELAQAKIHLCSIRSPTAQDRACRRIAQKSSFGRIAK